MVKMGTDFYSPLFFQRAVTEAKKVIGKMRKTFIAVHLFKSHYTDFSCGSRPLVNCFPGAALKAASGQEPSPLTQVHFNCIFPHLILMKD